MITGILLVFFGIWLGGMGGFKIIESKFFISENSLKAFIVDLYKNIWIQDENLDNDIEIIDENFNDDVEEEVIKEEVIKEEVKKNNDENSDESNDSNYISLREFLGPLNKKK